MKAQPIITNATVGRRLLRQRKAAMMSQAEVAAMSGMSEAKLSSIENGRRPPKKLEGEGLTRIYGLGEELAKETGEMIVAIGKGGWWEPASRSLLPDLPMLFELEHACVELMGYEPELISGLLQTDAYTRAVAESTPLMPPEHVSRVVDSKRQRRQAFWERAELPDAQFIMHESAVRRPFGGAEDQQEQLDRLIALSEKVDIRVIPEQVGMHASMTGPYMILVGDGDEPSVVYLESIGGCRYEDKATMIQSHLTVWHHTLKLAVPIKEYV